MTNNTDVVSRIATVIMVLTCSMLALNALAFASQVAVPIPAKDAWYFIEAFIRPAIDGQLGLRDFFVQRGPGDHSQPLHKLILLANLYLVDLDFRVEAIVGILIGVVTCSFLAWVIGRRGGTRGEFITFRLGGAVIFSVGLSLNATNIYLWSLVSLGWILILLAVIYWWLLASVRGAWRTAGWSCVTTCLVGVTADELVFPIFIALVCAWAVRERGRLSAVTFAGSVGGLCGLILARVFLAAASPIEGAADATAESLQGVLTVLSFPAALEIIVGPLGDSLVHRSVALSLFPSYAGAGQLVLAGALLLAHGAFWWRAILGKARPDGDILVLATAMMLLFYATIAGVVLSRVSVFGIDYVHQPRYVLFYQLNVIALVLMFMAPRARLEGQAPVASGSSLGWRLAPAAAILVLELFLSSRSWATAQGIRDYARNAAAVMANLGERPSEVPAAGCPDVLTICSSTPDVREGTMRLLQKHALSIYSHRFRVANGLEDLVIVRMGGDGAGNGPQEYINFSWKDDPYVQGLYPLEDERFRWTTQTASVQLRRAGQNQLRLVGWVPDLEGYSGPGRPILRLSVAGCEIDQIRLAEGNLDLTLDLPTSCVLSQGVLRIELSLSSYFRPPSPDGRRLGIVLLQIGFVSGHGG